MKDKGQSSVLCDGAEEEEEEEEGNCRNYLIATPSAKKLKSAMQCSSVVLLSFSFLNLIYCVMEIDDTLVRFICVFLS